MRKISNMSKGKKPPLVLEEVRMERVRQEKQWGGPKHDDTHTIQEFACWIRSRVDEVGNMSYPDTARRRLIQIAALAVAAVESMDRKQHQAPLHSPAEPVSAGLPQKSSIRAALIACVTEDATGFTAEEMRRAWGYTDISSSVRRIKKCVDAGIFEVAGVKIIKDSLGRNSRAPVYRVVEGHEKIRPKKINAEASKGAAATAATTELMYTKSRH